MPENCPLCGLEEKEGYIIRPGQEKRVDTKGRWVFHHSPEGTWCHPTLFRDEDVPSPVSDD